MSRRARSKVAMVMVASSMMLGLLVAPTIAAGAQPSDTGGPTLTVSEAAAEKAMSCSAGVREARRNPVLLVHGAQTTARHNWSWTYEPALRKLRIPFCTIAFPAHGTGDVQLNGEYVVRAIRTMHRRAGRRVSVVGYSMGGAAPRWALRFWPDTRRRVDDLVGFAASNHGTTTLEGDCGDGSCTPAYWQLRSASRFMRALNSAAETWTGVSYTSIYTRFDQVVQPNADARTGSSSLRTGRGRRVNVALQDICPQATGDHLTIGTIDPIAHALMLDALRRRGPADPARVSRAVCARSTHPGLEPGWPTAASRAAADFNRYLGAEVAREPRTRCYASPACASRRSRSVAASPRLLCSEGACSSRQARTSP